jgi:hypothetical protein
MLVENLGHGLGGIAHLPASLSCLYKVGVKLFVFQF